MLSRGFIRAGDACEAGFTTARRARTSPRLVHSDVGSMTHQTVPGTTRDSDLAGLSFVGQLYSVQWQLRVRPTRGAMAAGGAEVPRMTSIRVSAEREAEVPNRWPKKFDIIPVSVKKHAEIAAVTLLVRKSPGHMVLNY